jgi:cytochrome d ubiquinol oxidase subunit I
VLRTGLTLGALLIPLQILVGDLHGLNTLQHQPQKVAAMEGVWQTERGAPLLLFAVPDEPRAATTSRSASPSWRQLILKHDADGEIRGLNDFKGAKGEHPPVKPVFYGFPHHGGHRHADAGRQLGRLWLYRRAAGSRTRCRGWLLWGWPGMTLLGLGGHRGGLVRHRDRPPAVHRVRPAAHRRRGVAVPAPMIALTLALYVTVYLALLVAYVAS